MTPSQAELARELVGKGQLLQRRRNVFHLKIGVMLCFLLVLVKIYVDVANESAGLPLPTSPRKNRTVLLSPALFNASSTADDSLCRHTQQGRSVVTDEHGRMCPRSALVNGCCAGNASERFACGTCMLATGCCSGFELCVSCCLDPTQQPSLRELVNSLQTGNESPATAHVLSSQDRYGLCLALCRTTSDSISHGNRYRSRLSYCFLRERPAEDGTVPHLHPKRASGRS